MLIAVKVTFTEVSFWLECNIFLRSDLWLMNFLPKFDGTVKQDIRGYPSCKSFLDSISLMFTCYPKLMVILAVSNKGQPDWIQMMETQVGIRLVGISLSLATANSQSSVVVHPVQPFSNFAFLNINCSSVLLYCFLSQSMYSSQC